MHTGVGSRTGTQSMPEMKTNSLSLRSHQLSKAPQPGVGVHDPLPTVQWDIDLDHVQVSGQATTAVVSW